MWCSHNSSSSINWAQIGFEGGLHFVGLKISNQNWPIPIQLTSPYHRITVPSNFLVGWIVYRLFGYTLFITNSDDYMCVLRIPWRINRDQKVGVGVEDFEKKFWKMPWSPLTIISSSYRKSTWLMPSYKATDKRPHIWNLMSSGARTYIHPSLWGIK